MSAFRCQSIRSPFALVALCAALCAQSPAAGTRPDDYVARAKQLLLELYPGLDSRLHVVIIDHHFLRDRDVMNSFTLELDDLEPKTGTPSPACWCSAPAISADFLFDWQTENKELIRIGAVGPVVDGRRDKFAEEMNRHRKWSDAQVAAALNAAGARFGPDHKADFLRALPLEELRPFVGGRLEVVSAEFYVRDFQNSVNGRTGEAALYWRVPAKWYGSDGREADCVLAFEPFEGRLESIQRYFNPQGRGK